jgi:hypothetical protein
MHASLSRRGDGEGHGRWTDYFFRAVGGWKVIFWVGVLNKASFCCFPVFFFFLLVFPHFAYSFLVQENGGQKRKRGLIWFKAGNVSSGVMYE